MIVKKEPLNAPQSKASELLFAFVAKNPATDADRYIAVKHRGVIIECGFLNIRQNAESKSTIAKNDSKPAKAPKKELLSICFALLLLR